jgi:hypothetical protein
MPVPVDTLINELLALGTLDESTVSDLKRMQADAASGSLDADDEGYVRALHSRLTNAPLPEPVEAEPERLEGLTIAEWRDRALAAETEAGALRDQLAAPGATP